MTKASEPTATPDSNPDDFFFDAYDRDDIAYGDVPSRPLESFVRQVNGADESTKQALDLGAGAGRDSLFLVQSGYQVTAVDLSERGLNRIQERVSHVGLDSHLRTVVADVREYELEPNHFDVIVGTTILDHVPHGDAKPLFQAMANALTDRGMLYIEVHTTEDPACELRPTSLGQAPISETAGAVVNYFPPGQLAAMALQPELNLRILFYEERLEWDYTHGPEHQHGKQILVAVRAGFHPHWFGVERPFPRNQASPS